MAKRLALRIGCLLLFLCVGAFSLAENREIFLDKPGTLEKCIGYLNGSNIKISGKVYACDLSYLASTLRQKSYFETLTTVDLSGIKILLSDNSKQNSYTYVQDGQECTDVMSQADAIPESMFESCTSLIRMVLPTSLKQIGNRAFFGSPLLTIDIPQSVERVGRQAFQNCSHLLRVYICGSPMISRDAFKDTPKLRDVYIGAATPFAIDANAFSNYDISLHVQVNSYYKYKDDATWGKAKGICDMNGNLISKAPVTYHLEEPGTLNNMPWWGSRLDVDTISDLKVTGKLYASDISWLKSHMFGNGYGNTLRRLDLSEAELVIADNEEYNTYDTYFGNMVNGKGTLTSEAELSAAILGDCMELDFLGLPNGITNIPDRCFSSSTAIEMSIPKTVKSIGFSAFKYDEAISVVDIKDGAITSLGDGAFSYCSSLMSISLPDSITKIGSYCFYGCTSLKKVFVPFGVDKLEDQTFDGCTSLEFVRVGHRKKPTTIGSLAFNNCSSLKSVFFTSTITSLDYMCFAFCTSLEAIAIPESVTDIDSRSFSNCTNLKTIYVAPKEIYASKFDSWHFKGKLSVNLLKPFVSCIVGNYVSVAKTVCFRNKVLIDKAPTSFSVYSVKSIENGKVILSEVTNGVLEAGKAYVVAGNNVYFPDGGGPMYGITFTLEDGEGPLVDNAILQGVYEDTYAPVGSYVLQPDRKFHLVTQANTVKVEANHAYLNIPEADKAPVLAIQYGGETTDIRGITETQKEVDTHLYDLMGRRVTTPQKGQIYIRGGKKVIY